MYLYMMCQFVCTVHGTHIRDMYEYSSYIQSTCNNIVYTFKALSHYATFSCNNRHTTMFHPTKFLSCNLFHTTKPVSCQIFHVLCNKFDQQKQFFTKYFIQIQLFHETYFIELLKCFCVTCCVTFLCCCSN